MHGVIHNKIWKISGLENLLEKGCGDIRTQQMLRITAQGLFAPIIILAYIVGMLMTKRRNKSIIHILHY